MGTLLPSQRRTQFSDNAYFLSGVITELQRRLPYGNIKTCGAFKHLNVGCCDSCHTTCPYYDMNLIDLPDGGKAWVCENIEFGDFSRAVHRTHEPGTELYRGRLFIETFGGDDRKEV